MLHQKSGSGATPPRRPARRAALVLVLLIAVICGAVAAGSLWSSGSKTDRELAAHRHQVAATTTGPTKDPPVATRFDPSRRRSRRLRVGTARERPPVREHPRPAPDTGGTRIDDLGGRRRVPARPPAVLPTAL